MTNQITVPAPLVSVDLSANNFLSNDEIIRNLYYVAKLKDYIGFADLFADNAGVIDEGAGYAYRGAEELTRAAEIYATAMPDMHRKLIDLFVAGDRVIVELTLNGTSLGPLEIPDAGSISPTGKKIEAPCCDVFLLKDDSRAKPPWRSESRRFD